MFVKFWRAYNHLGSAANLTARVHRTHSRDLATRRRAA
jgi:hypothetical protein